MTPIGFAIIAVTVLLAMIVGAYLTVAVLGGDTTVIGSAGAAAGAFLATLVGAEIIRSRRSDR